MNLRKRGEPAFVKALFHRLAREFTSSVVAIQEAQGLHDFVDSSEFSKLQASHMPYKTDNRDLMFLIPGRLVKRNLVRGLFPSDNQHILSIVIGSTEHSCIVTNFHLPCVDGKFGTYAAQLERWSQALEAIRRQWTHRAQHAESIAKARTFTSSKKIKNHCQNSNNNYNDDNIVIKFRSHLALGDSNESFIQEAQPQVGNGLLRVGRRHWHPERVTYSVAELSSTSLHVDRRNELLGLLAEKGWKAVNTFDIASWAMKSRRTWIREIKVNRHLQQRSQRQMDFIFVPPGAGG